MKIRALDRDGKPFELEADGLLAICIQHEMDHWLANCLLTICHRSNNSAFVRRLRNWIVYVPVPDNKEYRVTFTTYHFRRHPDFAARHLDALLSSEHQIVGVFTQPDRPAGRGKN